MSQLKYIFVKGCTNSPTVTLEKIGSGGLASLMNLFGAKGVQFEADKKDLTDIYQEATNDPKDPNSTNNIQVAGRGLRLIREYERDHNLS